MDELETVKGIALAEVIKKIDDLNEKAWEVHITQPKAALELSSEAKTLSEEYSYQKGLAYAIRNMGVSYRYLSNQETALTFSFQALDMFINLGDKKGEAQAYISIGAIYYYVGDFERSLDYFLKGMHYSEEVGDKEMQAYAYNGAGYIYGAVLNDYKKGIELLQKALLLSNEIGVSKDLRPRILDSIAEVYQNNEQLEEAYKASLECLRLSEQLSQNVTKGYALARIGMIFMKQNRLNEAKEYFLQGLSVSREINNKFEEVHGLLNLGKLSLIQQNSKLAKEYLFESLKLAEGIKAKGVIYEVHEALADLYEKEKDIESFVKHYKLYHKYKSEVFKDEQETKQKYLAIQYEMEKLQKEAEINRLTNVVMKEKNAELQKKTKELEQSYNNISVLSKIGRDITSTLDLETILNTVYENVNQLMDATVFGIGIYNEVEEVIEYRLAIEEGKRYKPYQRKMNDKSQLAVWCIENNREVFINDIEKDHQKYISDKDMKIIGRLEDGSIPKSPNSLVYLPLQVKDKIVGLISVQSYQPNAYSQYHLDILKTLASYTSAALYNARSYEALQITLNELKLTQQQLVQSEKMASLGELTAGIAHEIQNPLNFVNNFSDVNKELIEELKIKNYELKIEDEEINELLNDIKANAEKINHHGKRADAIVKGMLQHSRKSSGQKELTDINALADEYLRLSYHGLRAKDKNFNATIETDFDNSIGKINIIPQDIGRVLLNLFNNAFYAVNEQKNKNLISYEPKVFVHTQKCDDKIQITVRDNGNGIPQKILDKIFQPFFTTKPTGQGTGLGLSLSYDIIKAHGGEIKVESKEGEGSEFVIQLPV
jgi:signal transduction histidine kinase/tetratricopeptide (TPR) repeat protein